jgi:hypothetical protein
LRTLAGEVENWPASAAVPYAHDLASDQLVTAIDVDAQGVAAAPFHWAALRAATRRVMVCRTAQRLDLPDPPFEDPIIVISPGRCGSTLLARLAPSLGLTGLSEPSIYLEAFLACRSARDDGVRSHIEQVLARQHADLLAPLQQYRTVLLKLHPYAVAGLPLVLRQLRHPPKIVALTREFAPWTNSWARAVGTAITHDVMLYERFLTIVADLTRTSICVHLLRYEDLLLQPIAALERLARNFDLVLDTQRAVRILEQDSQADTGMARTVVAGRSHPVRDPDVARLAWQLGRPEAAIQDLGLQGYL